MLRQPSTRPLPEEGGGAGDDDEEDDGSDTEMEGGHADDDSDGESTSKPLTLNKGKGKAISPLDRLKGKGKGKGKAVAVATQSPLKISTVREEEESTPKKSPSLLERRAKLSPTLIGLQTAAPPVKQANGPGGQNWSIGNEIKPQGAWTSFGQASPHHSPVLPKTPNRPALSKDQGSYFDIQPGSTGNSPATPGEASRAPTEAKDESKGLVRDIMGGLGLGAVIGEDHKQEPHKSTVPLDSPASLDGHPTTGVEADDESNDEDEDSVGTSRRESSIGGSTIGSPAVGSTALPASPQIPRPTTVTRPSLYSHASQSLVDLRAKPDMTTEQPISSSIEPESAQPVIASGKPALTTIVSGEEIRKLPARIEMPKRQSFRQDVPPTPGWAKPPPTPATPGGAGNVFWEMGGRKSGEESRNSTLKRRRSLGDIGKAEDVPPPDYQDAAAGIHIPRKREEEGKEKLPQYWCAVSFQH